MLEESLGELADPWNPGAFGSGKSVEVKAAAACGSSRKKNAGSSHRLSVLTEGRCRGRVTFRRRRSPWGRRAAGAIAHTIVTHCFPPNIGPQLPAMHSPEPHSYRPTRRRTTAAHAR